MFTMQDKAQSFKQKGYQKNIRDYPANRPYLESHSFAITDANNWTSDSTLVVQQSQDLEI